MRRSAFQQWTHSCYGLSEKKYGKNTSFDFDYCIYYQILLYCLHPASKIITLAVLPAWQLGFSLDYAPWPPFFQIFRLSTTCFGDMR